MLFRDWERKLQTQYHDHDECDDDFGRYAGGVRSTLISKPSISQGTKVGRARTQAPIPVAGYSFKRQVKKTIVEMVDEYSMDQVKFRQIV